MKSIILIHGPTGHAYRLEEHMGGYALLCAPLLRDGSIEMHDTGDDYNWGEVDFSRGLDEEQAKTAEVLRGTLALLEDLA